MPRFSECWRCGNTGDTVVCRLCQVAKYCSNDCQRNDKLRHETECKPVAIVKTCSSCRKTGPSLRVCTGCYRVFYCDINCQKSHRKEHKDDCSSTKAKIEALAEEMSVFHGPRFPKVSPKHYYWGNYPAYDGINLVENEGADYSLDLKVLYLGVGDLRNIALTCASLPDAYGHVVKFTLNDRESCILARLVLLLYMLIKGQPGVEKTVTEIWYSISLSEQTYNYLRVCLRVLIDSPSAKDLETKTEGLISINETHLNELKNVWIRWHNLQVKGTTWIQKQRQKEFSSNAGSYHGRSTYFNCIPQKHVKSARKWMEDGVFQRNQMPAFAENPTLTGYSVVVQNGKTYFYCIPSDILPFTGWDYLEVKKFKPAISLVTMYDRYIENLLKKLVKKMTDKQVHFQVLLCDCLAIEQYIDKETKYDRILTSNLMDYVLLPNLLKICSLKLNHSNPYATIVTETHNWTRDFCPDGDVGSFSNMFTLFTLMNVALEDTKSRQQAHDGGTGVREYLENSAEFIDFIRALFYTYSLTKMNEGPRGSTESNKVLACVPVHSPVGTQVKKVPTVKVLGNEFQLRLRDGFRNENRIATFKLAVNRRRVTMIAGLERVMEWVPLQSECPLGSGRS